MGLRKELAKGTKQSILIAWITVIFHKSPNKYTSAILNHCFGCHLYSPPHLMRTWMSCSGSKMSLPETSSARTGKIGAPWKPPCLGASYGEAVGLEEHGSFPLNFPKFSPIWWGPVPNFSPKFRCNFATFQILIPLNLAICGQSRGRIGIEEDMNLEPFWKLGEVVHTWKKTFFSWFF